ncbi:uncharacterized protein LOC107627537 [Arachis ipaensis]|uniref:uncharacterized protein LOC107627537 n=1 Tax=Arachis ipaensis TaxID=130454 RepID=UPI0007AF3F5D|nr:uncharacterized protein LOC107627537 [Arachis ipaensis]XP_025636184.1 uncharacterized protein LOC112730305 [Arachis hypogaea]
MTVKKHERATHEVGIMHTKWLGAQFKKKVESNLRIKIKELVAKAQKKWNLTVTKSMAAKTKQEALSQIQGAFREQYKRINDYCAELLRANPDCMSALMHARRVSNIVDPLLVWSLDGCFLKTPQGGQLLTAIGRDPNDQILSITYAVVEAETKDSWGLLQAFEEVIPGVDNRYCVRHLYNNFRKKFPGLELKNQMWQCAKSTHWKDWEKEMKSPRIMNEGEFRHLNNIPPRLRKKLEKRATFARDCRPYWSTASKYEVMCGLEKFVVDLSASECSCRRWQMSRLPFPHAISCITFKGLDLESYVDDCYKKDAYLRYYQEVIHPLNGLDIWERTQYDDVMPPPYRRPSHRLVKKRKRGPGDEDNRRQTHLSRRGQIQRCCNCGTVGHKKGGCTNPKRVQSAN